MTDTPPTAAAPPGARHVSPTLLIGLGGTGKDVLLRIRRMFFERHGQRPDGGIGYPVIGYLALDTDPGALDRLEGESASDFVLRAIQFKRGGTAEALDCTVAPRQLEDYFRGGEQQFPHLFRWLPAELKKFGANGIVGGAGQNRLFGRLAFFHHFASIRDTLKARINQIMAEATLPARRAAWLAEQRTPIEVNPLRLEVVLVYSLAGGTGAGMFLDMGWLARHVVERELTLAGVQPFFTHYALLPEAFVQEAAEGRRNVTLKPEQRRKIQENAFACLREMEYFSMPPRQAFDLSIPPAVAEDAGVKEPWYRVQWQLDGPVVEIHSSPWDTCYLLGGGNDAMGSQCLPPAELYQMIAERLYLQFAGGQFANLKASALSNEVDETLQSLADEVRDDRGNVLYSQFLSKRFSTFGLSQIFFDRERMRRAAAHRLAWKLVAEWWLRPAELAPVEVPRLAKEDLHGGAGGRAEVVTATELPGDSPLSLAYDALRDQVLLEDRDQDRHRTWFQVILEDEQQRRRRVEEGKFDAPTAEAIEPLLQAHSHRLKRVRGAAGETGLAVRSFERHRQQLEVEIERRLRCLVLHRLQQLGVRGALQLLEEYANLHKGELQKAQHLAAKKAAPLPPYQDRVGDARRLPLAFYARTAVRLELQRALRQVRDHLLKAFHREALPEIRACLDRVQQRIGNDNRAESYAGLLERFQSLLESRTDAVVGVQHYLAQRFRELRTQDAVQERTIGLLDQLSDAAYDSRIHQIIAPELPGNALDMSQLGPRVERQVLDQLAAVNPKWRHVRSVGDLALTLLALPSAELPAQAEIDELAADLAEACETLLLNFAGETSALEQFTRDVPLQKLRLDSLRTYSGCFLRGHQGPEAQRLDTAAVARLGVAGSKSRAAEEFRRQVEAVGTDRQLLGVQPFEIDDDTLVLYQEKTGLPLCHYHGLEALGQWYGKSLRQREVHIDYHGLRGRLPEIRRVDQERQKHLAQCVEWTLYGICTGVLRFEQRYDQQRFWLAVRQGHGAPLTVPLGSQFEEVAAYLAEHAADRGELQRQLDRWFQQATVKDDGEPLVLLWCALQDLQEEIRRRVQQHIDRGRLSSAEGRHHPLLSILDQRMLPRVRERLLGLPAGPGWLNSKLDAGGLATDLEGDDLDQALRLRAELLQDCYGPLSDAVPIPVLRPGALLDRHVFGDLMSQRPGPRPANVAPLRRFQRAEDESV